MSSEQALKQLRQKTDTIRQQLHNVILGQNDVVAQVLITVLSGGHGLLIGVPGLGKTLLVRCLARVLGLQTQRIQCTPDLMPSDILGTEILDQKDATKPFRFIKGPIFSQLLMVDEINRANPRTQSALLQAMEEKTVSIAGETFDLPSPFHVLATQNPLEHEGTYPLPEAQLDRFLMAIPMDMPERADEKRILIDEPQRQENSLKAVTNAQELITMQETIRTMAVGESLIDDIVDFLRRLRPQPEQESDVLWGPGPRGGQALLATAKAKAAMEGRLAPSWDDVQACTFSVLNHRIAPSFAAQAQNINEKTIIHKAMG
ncbi:MAG: AAA family ATPase [Alphaproteobacteria bacterium GM202ARS2]|nr:AAA family ATPase [Alphaproteobacteria bacterium GM202ARS2]